MSKFSTPNFSVDLSDQVALVTGASSGLGYRFSKVLAGCGAKVAIAARRVEKLEVEWSQYRLVAWEKIVVNGHIRWCNHLGGSHRAPCHNLWH